MTSDDFILKVDQRTNIRLRGSAGIIIVGRPGTGKTMLSMYLLLQVLKKGASVYLVDNKRSDLSGLKDYLPDGDKRVAVTANQTARLLRKINNNMNARYENHHNHWAWDWVDYRLRPQIILMDEVAATMSEAMNAGNKLKNEILNYTRSIILRGRQAGIFMLICSQRLSAEIMDRDQTLQLSSRIVMGEADRDTYRMAFPTADLEELPMILNQPGHGLIYSDDFGLNVPQPFVAPNISNLKVNEIVRRLSDQTDRFDYIKEPYWQL